MPRHDSYWDWYPEPSKPIATRGGIKLQGTGRDQTWWARRWIAVLERFDLGSRLTRGRSYARKGQVLDITIDRGHAAAKVQGSQPRPYKVSIIVKALSAAQWDRAVEAIASQAAFTAQLLNGSMPQEIESAFTAAGVSLFPASLREIETECSCPDWSNPCKHIAAVYYLLGQEFDRDPFLIFMLRGMPREDLLARLGTRQGEAPPTETAPPPEPLPADPARFWQGDPTVVFALTSGHPTPVIAPLLRQLGPFPFWRGESDLRQTLEPLYRAAAAQAAKMGAELRGEGG